MIYAMYYDFQEVKKIVAYKSLYDMSIFDKAKAESIFYLMAAKQFIIRIDIIIRINILLRSRL